MSPAVEEREVRVEGLPTRYLAAGAGPPLVLLHGAGDNALDWQWVLPTLARTRRVYAPDLPGSGKARPSADYSPAFFERFVAGFLGSLGIESSALVGNSFGGLVALRLALSDPARVSAIGLIDSAGLGRAVNPTFAAVNVPGLTEVAIPFRRTPPGAHGRALERAALLFARPENAPREWLAEQQRLALLPGFLEAHVAVLRAQVSPLGQREVLVDRLPHLEIPTLVLWGVSDRVFPAQQARNAAARLRNSRLEILPHCGHLPHVERPDVFATSVHRFLADSI